VTETLLDLFRHNLWANEKIIDYCRSQPEELLDKSVGGTYGTPRATLIHLVAAEEWYVFRLTGKKFEDLLSQDEPFPEPFPGFNDLERRAKRSGEAVIEAARSITNAQMYRTFPDEEGKVWEVRKPLVLVQVINHATEHRAQIVTTLSALGAEPIELDVWRWGPESGAMTEVTPGA
jgi:uncharacterized damage-inducible protein DinB